MTAVFKHELRSYFHSLTAYVFGAFLLAFIGIGAMLYNLQAAVSNFEYVLSFASLVFVVIVPVLTMRVLAEERRQKTDQLLYSKLAGYELDTYDKEEGDLDGPFTLAVSVEAGSGQMVWFSSSAFLDDKYNALSSGANVNLGMNALSSLVGESEAMAIRSKSLNYNYLTISASTSSLLKVLMIGIVPLAYLGVGIAVVVKRRRMQNEAV